MCWTTPLQAVYGFLSLSGGRWEDEGPREEFKVSGVRLYDAFIRFCSILFCSVFFYSILLLYCTHDIIP